MTRPSRFSPEVRERAVRMVVEHEAAHDSQWAAITSIAEKIGCTAETLRKWVRQAERDTGKRRGSRAEVCWRDSHCLSTTLICLRWETDLPPNGSTRCCAKAPRDVS